MNVPQEKIQQIHENMMSLQPCSVCGRQEWVVADLVFELREYKEGKLVLKGEAIIYPIIPVTCGHCGNVILLSAVRLGLDVSPEPREEGTEGEEGTEDE